jgi:hypothetical protein
MPAIGITLEAVATGAYGRIMQIGLVENANTSAFTAGDVLYVSSTVAGVLVKTAPLWPNIRQEIGTILAVDASVGSVQVVARSMFNEGILDHGGLLGLADNDHTQYLLLTGGTMSGNITMGEDTWIGRSSSTERIVFDGGSNYIDIHVGAALRVYGANDDTHDFELYNGTTKMFGIRRYGAASPDVARLDFTVGYHWFMNNVWTFAAGASFMTVPRDSYGIRVGAAHDAGIDYDGTDMHINPKYVGSGKLWVGTDSTQADIWFNQCRSTGGLVEIYAATAGSCSLNFVEGANTAVRWKAQYDMDAFHLGMGSLTGRQLVFVNTASIDDDYAHAVSDDPIIYIQSATAAATRTTENISFTHNKTDGVVATELGNIDLNPAGEVMFNGTTKALFGDTGTYWQQSANGVLAGVTDGTITLGAAATNQMIVTSGALTYWTGTGGVPFADMYVNGNAVETTIAGAGTYVQITVFTTNGEALDAVPDHTNDHITITKAGRYFVSWWVSVESIGAGAADHVSFEVRKNNGTVAFANTEGRRKLAGGGGDTGSISGGGYIDLAATDTVELWGTNEDNATNFLVTNVTLAVGMKAGT